MTIEKAIKLLIKEYERAKGLSFVWNPVAYALYQVWKMEDKEGVRHNEKDVDSR